MRTRIAMAGLLVALLLGACAAPGQADTCRIDKLAELPIDFWRGLPLVNVQIAGKPATLLLDTGSDVVLLREDAFARLGLERDYARTVFTTGLGATSSSWPSRPVAIALGGLTRDPAPITVAQIGPKDWEGHVDGVLGGQVLANYDVEIDMPHRRLALYRARMCPNGASPLPGAPTTLPATGLGGARLAAPIEVDGIRLVALLDTGASRTIVDPERVGLTDADLAHDAERRSITADPVGLAVRSHRFREIKVGAETVARPILVVGRLRQPGFDALLGTDFWRARHVWLSYAGRTITIGAREAPR